jgi:hypothetical protein
MRVFYRMMLGAVLASLAPAAQAGVYSDDLAKCLVAKTTEADKAQLMQWIFAAMSASPAVSSMTSLSPKQREEMNRKGAALFSRLLIADCRSETVTALKYEGQNSIEPSFKVLGEVAMTGLMRDPAVTRELDQLSTFFDTTKLEALVKEAGLAVEPEKSK